MWSCLGSLKASFERLSGLSGREFGVPGFVPNIPKAAEASKVVRVITGGPVGNTGKFEGSLIMTMEGP